jgi:hypothetical protein
MKELSIEEKAKRYDEAIERYKAKQEYESQKVHEFIEYLFPELAESEDERIRKDIIEAVELHKDFTQVRKEHIYAWLEKQGNLVKYYEDKLDRCACENFNKGYKKALEKQGENNMGISEATKKDLEDNLNKALEKETSESCNEFLDEQGEQKPVFEMKTPEESLGIDSDTYNKIVDECIYGEQNPAAWSEEDEEMCQETIDWFEKKCFPYALESENPARESIKWLKSLKDRAQPQKQEWSDVDKDILFRTIDNLKFLRDTVSKDPYYTVNTIDIEREINWLSSIKDRVQPKQKWSEEDEQVIEDAESWLDMLCSYLKNNSSQYIPVVKEVISKLKSLRPQSQWKPSNGQMLAINTAINVLGKGTINGKYLIELHEQLKKQKQ